MKWILTVSVLLIGLQSKADFFQSEDFAVALGGQASSLIQKRGIITYGGYQIVPIYAVHLWNPNLMIAGSAAYYKLPLTENQGFRFRLNVDSTLDQPLYYTSEAKDDRVRRDSTSEFDVFYEAHTKGGSHFRFMFSQDLVAHQGFYTEAYGHLALWDLIRNSKDQVIVQPGVFASIGAGNEPHNTYLYGEGAGDYQVTNIQYGLSVLSPDVIDSFWPTLKISRFELIGDKTRRAGYVKERSDWQAELIFAFRVW